MKRTKARGLGSLFFEPYVRHCFVLYVVLCFYLTLGFVLPLGGLFFDVGVVDGVGELFQEALALD